MNISASKKPVVVIACKVFQDLLERLLPPNLASQISFLDYGLHRVPSKLTWHVQEAVDAVEEPSLIVLGYGLCGNGLKDIRAGKHTLLIPRTDDCIAILLGSYAAYMREFEAEPGTYYLSKGWLESGSNPLQEFEECVEKYGRSDAQWIMDQQYQNYERLLFVAQNQKDLETYRPQALKVAEYCQRWNMRYEERLGSEDFIIHLAMTAVAARDGKINELDKSLRKEFVLVQPGDHIQQEWFIR